MRWRGRRQSSNIEDRRGAARAPMRLPGGFGRGGFGGGLGRGGLRRGVRRGGIGGFGLVIVVLVALYFGVDPGVLLQDGPVGGGVPPSGRVQGQTTGDQEELVAFVSVVLADTEDTWHEQFNTWSRSSCSSRAP
jgi:predicted metalloprotease